MSQDEGTSSSEAEDQESAAFEQARKNASKQVKNAEPAGSNKPVKKKTISFQDGITIDVNTPMPQYNQGHVKAYRAFGRIPGQGEIPMFAYVCDKSPLPRLDLIKRFESFMSYNLCTLIKHGVLYWPATGDERYVFVYRDNWGNALIPPDAKQAGGIKPEVMMEKILAPLVPVLRDLREHDIHHGAIRPSNLWVRDLNAKDHIILGDCLTAPAGYVQDAFYEPISRAMTDPIARGTGTHADDMYALGVTLTTLLRTNDISEEMDYEEMIRKKMRIGSYGTVTGRDRFTGAVLELLRGLLHDDEKERWDIDDVQAWIDGRRLTPRPILKRKKAARPLVFGEERYLYIQPLAMDIEQDILEARRIIHEGELSNWLGRALESKRTAQSVEFAVEHAESIGGSLYDELLISCVSMALDPHAPIRFKGKHVNPNGLGVSLVDAIVNKGGIQVYQELLASGLVSYYIREYDSRNADATVMLARFDACEKFAKSTKAGFGLERVLYTLNPHVPCLSPSFKDYYILSPEDVLPAFEEMCRNNTQPNKLVDRHIVAFLFAKEAKLIDLLIRDFDAVEPYRQILFQLRVFAKLQSRYKPGPVPNIAAMFMKQMQPVFERFHDKFLREKIAKDCERHANSGELDDMAELVDDFELRESDRKAFFRSMKEYKKSVDDRKKLIEKLEDKKTFGKATGRDIAATASCVIAVIVIVAVTVIYFSTQ